MPVVCARSVRRIAAAVAFGASAAVLAQTAPPYAIRHAIANGGGRATGGTYAVFGVIGQHDADPLQPSSGGAYTVVGGLQGGSPDPRPDALFADGFE